MTISRYFVRYLPTNQDEKSATLIRKDRICKSATASREYVPTIELTAFDLHARYGDPDVERFVVRPSITLMVAYDTAQAACQMLVEAQEPLVHLEQSPRKKMAPEVLDSIVDEIVPPGVRGRRVYDLVQMTGCGRAYVDFYENVTISRSTDHCLPLKPERDGSATIVFKRQACSR